jgi:hypothetical protein
MAIACGGSSRVVLKEVEKILVAQSECYELRGCTNVFAGCAS